MKQFLLKFGHALVGGLCLLSGTVQAAGLTADTITIGQSAGFTGTLATKVKELNQGAQAYFDAVNAAGGVYGRRIVLKSLDDGNDPKRTAENTQKLIDADVFSLFLYHATPNTEAAVPIFTAAKVPLVATSSAAQSMRVPVKRYLFPVIASYHAQMDKMVELLNSLGIQKIAIVHSDDTFGKDGLDGAMLALKRFGLEPYLVASFPRGTLNVDPVVSAIDQKQPQAVLLVSAANAGAEIIKRVKALGNTPFFMGLSNMGTQAFVNGVGQAGRGTGIAQIGPDPWAQNTPLSREYTKTMKKIAPDAIVSYTSLEGYIGAKVLVEGLRRAGPQPTREKFVQALESMGKFDLGGLTVSYSPEEHTGSRFVELTVIDERGRFLF